MIRMLSFLTGILCPLFSILIAQSQFQTGGSHSGLYPDAVIKNDAVLQWKFRTDGAVRSTPAVTDNAVVFGSSDGNVYCLTPDGKERWRFQTDGPVSSSPAIDQGTVYITSRSNTLYALHLKNGTLRWKKYLGTPLPYEWGFDYYVGSPTLDNGTVYTGSADGHVFALGAKDGKERWKFRTAAPVRATPACDAQSVYVGDCSGKAYALDKSSGALLWTATTIGDTLNNEQFGFDRKALISSPTLYENMVFIGSRDGWLYAFNRSSGKHVWTFDYAVSWVISTVAVTKGLLVTGTSDGRFVHALDVNTGKERWRFMTQATVWASPAISGNDVVVIPSNDGYVYALELMTGKEVWRYKIGPQLFSSVVPVKDKLYSGSDDGHLYALRTSASATPSLSGVKRAVFWMKSPVIQTFKAGMDVAIRDHFIREGYEFYDETDVKDFLLQRIGSDTASVLVFATNWFLPPLTKDTLGSNLLQAYLKSGGSVVMLGMNPAAYELDSTGKYVVAVNFDQAKRLTGIPYRYKDLRTHGGFYSSFITPEGKARGLKSNFVGISGLPVSDVTVPLAVDENGKATAWFRSSSSRKNSGYYQFSLTPERLYTLPEIQKVIEYGLRISE
jgi:outer membrane protein assembly factor BamB